MANTTPYDNPIKQLEEYLRHEELYEVIPEHRRPDVFRWPDRLQSEFVWGFIWLSIFWLPEIGVVLMAKGNAGLQFAMIAPPATLVGYLIMLGLLLSTLFLNTKRPPLPVGPVPVNQPTAPQRKTLNERITEVSKILAVGLLVGAPLVLAFILWWHTGSWPEAAWYFAIYMTLSAVLILLAGVNEQLLYKLYVAKGFVSMAVQIVRKLVRDLPSIASILLVIVLFSIFSTEFWEALGNLKPYNLAMCVILLTFLPLIFAVSSIRREADEIIKTALKQDNFLQNVIFQPAAETQFIKEILDDDRIKAEDWEAIEKELAWRDHSKLCEDIQPILRRRAGRWLAVLLTSTVVFLFIAFFIYFSLLFHFLVEPATLAKWLNGGQAVLAVDNIELTVPGLGQSLKMSSTVIPIAKVSLLLSSFIAMMSTVYVLTEDGIKQRFTERLRLRARSWIAVSCIYRNLISPMYQVWQYNVRVKDVACVTVVTPEGSNTDAVKAACEDVCGQLRKYRKLVLVTAFEQREAETAYTYGMSAKSWQMIFEPKTNGQEPIEYVLPPEPAANGQQPDSWFGNTERARQFSRALLNGANGVSHPYVFDGGLFLNFVIRREGKLKRRVDYFNFMKSVMSILNKGCPPPDLTVTVYLYHGRTQEELAFLLYNRQLSEVMYRDAFDDRIQFVKRRKVFPAMPRWRRR